METFRHHRIIAYNASHLLVCRIFPFDVFRAVAVGGMGKKQRVFMPHCVGRAVLVTLCVRVVCERFRSLQFVSLYYIKLVEKMAILYIIMVGDIRGQISFKENYGAEAKTHSAATQHPATVRDIRKILERFTCGSKAECPKM